MNNEIIGWVSSAVLILTLGIQLEKQWRTKSSQAISIWLFLGQLIAELGFVTYSYMVGNWIFFVTNLVLVIENLVGLWMTNRFAEKKDAESQ